MAQPVVAQGWSDRLIASVGAWTPWSSPAALPLETTPSTTGGMLDRAMTAAKAYVPDMPPLATDVADRASGLIDRAVLYAKSYGPGVQPPESEAPKAEEGWSDSVKQSMGCLIGGSTGTGLAILAGGENLVNIIAGGIVPAGNPLALYVGVAGVVFASFCAVGQALTPLFLEYATEVPFVGHTPLTPFPARPGNLPDARFFRLISY